MKKLHTYIGKHWLGYMFAILCMIAAIVLDMIYPMITESIIDDVMLGGKTELLFGLLVGIVIVGVGRAITGYFKEFTFDKLASGIGSEIRKDLFNHIQSLSMNFFAKTNTGELMARVKDDVDRVWDVLGFVGMLLIEVAIHISIVLYCIPGKAWALGLSYPGTSSLNPGLHPGLLTLRSWRLPDAPVKQQWSFSTQRRRGFRDSLLGVLRASVVIP